MNSFCGECGEWAVGLANLDGRWGTFGCGACGHQTDRAVWPLLVVTGASGSGKTAIIEPLRRRVPAGVTVFDKDLMWATDRDQAYNNFFRVASALAQAGVQAVIVGTLTPENVEGLTDRDLVGEIAYLNLHCDDAERERRLQARPAWRRSSDPAFIERHRLFAQWLLDHMETVRTDTSTPEEAAGAVAAWVRRHLRPQPAGLHNVTLYVAPGEFDVVRRFYAGVLGSDPLFEEPGHICCFDVSGDGRPLALCVHEAEPGAGHPGGTRELFLWVTDVEDARRRAEGAGHTTRTMDRGELQLRDPLGNRLRLHPARW